MLSLQLKSGEYLTIGDSIAVQVFQTGPSFRVAVKAPREIPILRGEVLERGGDGRPSGIHERRPKSPSARVRDARNLEALALRRERQAELFQRMQSLLDRMDALADAAGRQEIEDIRSQLAQIAAAEGRREGA